MKNLYPVQYLCCSYVCVYVLLGVGSCVPSRFLRVAHEFSTIQPEMRKAPQTKVAREGWPALLVFSTFQGAIF